MACTTTCLKPAPAQAHCGACHRTFGGVRPFDRYRKGGICNDPAELGMEQNARGVWRVPMSPERLAALTAR